MAATSISIDTGLMTSRSRNWRADGISAFRAGHQPGISQLREATIVTQDPRLLRRYLFTSQAYVSPGLTSKFDEHPEEQRPLYAGWFKPAQGALLRGTNKTVDVEVDLIGLPGLSGQKIPLLHFPVASLVLSGQTSLEVTPVAGKFKVSLKAPLKSTWCRFAPDETLEALPRDELKKLPPTEQTFPWLNEDPSSGVVMVYADAGGQALAFYYSYDFPGTYVRQSTPDENVWLQKQLNRVVKTESAAEQARYIIEISDTRPFFYEEALATPPEA